MQLYWKASKYHTSATRKYQHSDSAHNKEKPRVAQTGDLFV